MGNRKIVNVCRCDEQTHYECGGLDAGHGCPDCERWYKDEAEAAGARAVGSHHYYLPWCEGKA